MSAEAIQNYHDIKAMMPKLREQRDAIPGSTPFVAVFCRECRKVLAAHREQLMALGDNEDIELAMEIDEVCAELREFEE